MNTVIKLFYKIMNTVQKGFTRTFTPIDGIFISNEGTCWSMTFVVIVFLPLESQINIKSNYNSPFLQ